MSPDEIGYAAAYEAYRTWIHNSSIYEPLGGDPERQREALIGLSAAEGLSFGFIVLGCLADMSMIVASRLMQSVGRDLDYYGRTTAVDAAASTASNLFDEVRSRDMAARISA